MLVAAATGVASLIFLSTRGGTVRRVQTSRPPEPAERRLPVAADGRGCAAGRTLAARRRSIVFEVVTRLIFHTIMVFSIYLLFSGHNARAAASPPAWWPASR